MYVDGQRRMAWVARVEEIFPIEGKDRIVQYRVGGWLAIDAVGKYAVGDSVIYVSIDSWVPTELAPFLTKKGEPREYEGVKGERLKTIKMGGAMSQGLLLPLELAVDKFFDSKFDEGQEMGEFFFEDADMTELLGILKWESTPEFRAANAKGNFPHFLRKTDQERVQNVKPKTIAMAARHGQDHGRPRATYEVTEKLEGQSFTAYLWDEVFGVCSRNQDLKTDEPSTWVDTAQKYGIEVALRDFYQKTGMQIAIQGEQVGPGIEGNIYKLDSVKLFVYDVFNIGAQRYFSPTDARKITAILGLDYVPVIDKEFILPENYGPELLASAFHCSALADCVAEGDVYKLNSEQNDFSFKAVSNEYLLKDKQHTPWLKTAA